ncbi:helix-turn-helix domain-containing protein [Paenarthrobacter sp. NPDC090522]|uniref:helix-turn-helix domain-containing protein n=1 Tax=Paenarthrobacter sp. NPDC090522 TaxID=3364383 RepID=UPI0037FFA00E
MTIGEVSLLTRTPVATLRYWRYQGKGPRSALFGNRILYRRSDVTAWIDSVFKTEAA